MQGMYDIFVYGSLFMGIYFLFCGLTKRGGIYNHDYPEKIKDEVNRSLSVLAIITGIILTVSSAFELSGWIDPKIAVFVSVGSVLVVVVVFVVYFKKKFGKYVK